MLKYNLNLKDTTEEIVNINILTYFVNDVEYDDNDKIIVYCVPLTENDKCNIGEELTITKINEFINDCDDTGVISDIQLLEAVVKTSDIDTNNFSFYAPRYRNIEIQQINEVSDENGKLFWEFIFKKGHYFSEFSVIEFDVFFGLGLNNRVIHFDDVQYVNCKTLLWEIQENIEYIDELSKIIFSGHNVLNNKIKIRRKQTLFDEFFNHDANTPPTITVNRTKVKIDIPLVENFSTNVNIQDDIDTNFVNYEVNKSIPQFIEMEKCVYTPVIAKLNDEGNIEFSNISKINFNLHFRVHSGDNWIVEDKDGWNFSEYVTSVNDYYYSYKNKSNQSDLLGYLGFTNNDIRYQKNKLQKSFLRLSFYDSTDSTNQQLLAYSTIFFNTNNLYSKYMKGVLLDDWYVNESAPNVKFDTISTYFELDIHNAPIPKKIKSNDELIENYRLSSQISVQDKYSSNISSEGFYLYLYADNKTFIPDNIYMKVEFNHAGYGRTIPMMMPYFIKDVDNIPDERVNLFKTNTDIINDWKKNGYGVLKYNEYSYLKMNYVFDEKTNRYIYYINPDIYGNLEGPILNINLYEARIKI